MLFFICKFCNEKVQLNNENVNHIRGKKAQHLRICKKYLELKNKITKEILVNEYIRTGASALEIAQKFLGLNNDTVILKLLHKYRIKLRSIQQANKSMRALNRRQKTCILKYDVDNASKNPIIKEKMINNVDRVKHSKSARTTFKKFSKSKWRKRYEKARETLFKNYGVYNVFSLPEVIKKSSMKRLGFKPEQEKEWIEYRNKYLLPKYNYPFKFYDKHLRKMILKDQESKCGYCRIKISTKTKLSLHHINRDKKDCSRINLIFLCYKCHLGIFHKNYTKEIQKMLWDLNKELYW